MNHHKISKIISGGQTGADRAGIDVAIYGLIMEFNSCWKKNRGGHTSPKIQQNEGAEITPLPGRTEKNVLDSDATLIFTFNRMGSGSALTKKIADQHYKAMAPY